jgi:hypothetical protein
MTFKRRDGDLVVETAGDELVIYDLRTDAVHCLDAEASAVWRALDTEQETAAIAAASGLDDDVATAALVSLADRELVEFEGDTRRTAMRKVLVGAALAVPVIASIEAPAAYAAGTGVACTKNPTDTCKVFGSNYSCVGQGNNGTCQPG